MAESSGLGLFFACFSSFLLKALGRLLYFAAGPSWMHHWSEIRSSSLTAVNGPTLVGAVPIFIGLSSSLCVSFPVSFYVSLVPFLYLQFLLLPLGSVNKVMWRLFTVIG